MAFIVNMGIMFWVKMSLYLVQALECNITFLAANTFSFFWGLPLSAYFMYLVIIAVPMIGLKFVQDVKRLFDLFLFYFFLYDLGCFPLRFDFFDKQLLSHLLIVCW